MYKHTVYEALKAQHKCQRCKKKDAMTINGHLLCADCTKKKSEMDHIRYERKKNNPKEKEEQEEKGYKKIGGLFCSFI